MITRLIALSCVMLACGGKSVQNESTATTSQGPITSREAFDAIRAELPSGVRFLELRMHSGGTLQPDGRDQLWFALILDADRRNGWSGHAEPSGTSIDVVLVGRELRECSSAGLVEVDSAVVVPNALARVRELARSGADDETIVYWQQAPCQIEATDMAFTRTGHIVEVHQRGPDWAESFFVHFGDAGELVEFCGPCDSGLHAVCSNCAR